MDRIQGFSSLRQASSFYEELAIPIVNPDAQSIRSGNLCFASILWEQICSIGSASSSETIVEALLKQDKLIDWIARQSEPKFQNAMSRVATPTSSHLSVLFHLIHLASLAQTNNFTPHALLYLLYRALEAAPEEEFQKTADKLIEQHPRLSFYLRSINEPLHLMQKEMHSFCRKINCEYERSEELTRLLSALYFSVIEKSEINDLAINLEENKGEALSACLERATPEYWLKLFPEGIFDACSLKHPEAAWKMLFQHLRSYAHFSMIPAQDKKQILTELSALSRDISYFDLRHPSGQQLRYLVKQAYRENGNGLAFPYCFEHLEELQKRIEICRKHFQPKKILTIVNSTIKDFDELMKAKQNFSSSFNPQSFFSIFAEPIYRASAIYLFSVLTSSNQIDWPPTLHNAWEMALKNHPLPLDNPCLAFSDYERFIYEVWDQFSSENSLCSQIDLPDLLKRRIENLDQSALCKLYNQMNREPNQENRHTVLLAFFSEEDGNLRNIDWLLEGFLR